MQQSTKKVDNIKKIIHPNYSNLIAKSNI